MGEPANRLINRLTLEHLREMEYNLHTTSTSIRISEETKRKIHRLKRPDETFDELINRLASEKEGITFGAIYEETWDRILQGVEEHREATGIF